MKVIDLLNKIANGEEVPKKIHYNCVPLYWCEPCKIYETMTDDELCGKDLYTLLDNLNDEVEIIEDTPKEEIEKLQKEKQKLEKIIIEQDEEQRKLFNHIVKDDYKQRIDKAIEYIEHAQNFGKEKAIYVNGDDLLDILRGK